MFLYDFQIRDLTILEPSWIKSGAKADLNIWNRSTRRWPRSKRRPPAISKKLMSW